MHSKEAFVALLLLFLASAPVSSQVASSRPQQLQKHEHLAQQYLREKKPDLAVPELRAVLALDPNNAEARGNLGVLLFFRGDYTEATKELRAAWKLQPGLWKVQALLGMSEVRTGEASSGRKDLEEAFPHLQEEKIKMEVGKALIESYTSTQDLDLAAATVSALLKLEPTDTGLLFTAYQLYSNLADEAVLEMAMTAPDSAQMHQMMARVLIKEGDNPAAIVNYRAAIELNPENASLHFELAELLYASGNVKDKKEAVVEYKKTLALNPLDGKAESELGKIAAYNGDTKVAFAHYSRAVKLRPNDAIALTGLAGVLISMQQPDKALRLLERAVQLDPGSATAHYRLSMLYRRAGRKVDAGRELAEYFKYKKMQAQLAAILKKMRVQPAKDAIEESNAVP